MENEKVRKSRGEEMEVEVSGENKGEKRRQGLE